MPWGCQKSWSAEAETSISGLLGQNQKVSQALTSNRKDSLAAAQGHEGCAAGARTDLRTGSSVSGFSMFGDDVGALQGALFSVPSLSTVFGAYLPDSREIT